jgi:hypothetical protein
MLAGVTRLSYVISLALSFIQAARFLGSGVHPYFWILMIKRQINGMTFRVIRCINFFAGRTVTAIN